MNVGIQRLINGGYGSSNLLIANLIRKLAGYTAGPRAKANGYRYYFRSI